MEVLKAALISYAYESITVAENAVGLTETVYNPPPYNKGSARIEAFITLETAQIRWRIDGTVPTSTEGHLLEVGQTLSLQNQTQITRFKAIKTGESSGVMKVTYMRQ